MNLINDELGAALIYSLGWTLLHFLWQGSVLAGGFALALFGARRARPQLRYALGCATLVGMVMAPAATFMIIWRAAPGTAGAFIAANLSAPDSPPLQPGMNGALRAIVLAWILGAGLFMLWLAGGWIQAQRLRRLEAMTPPARLHRLVEQLSAAMRVRATVRIVDSAAAAAPLALGWLSPVILLPASLLAGLPTGQLQAILAHELAHIRRHDYVINILQMVVESLLFYHPAVWWVSRRVRLEREYCCDDMAAAVCGNKLLYARALTELEALRGASARLGLSSQGGSLMKRIVRLVDEPASRGSSGSRILAALAAVGMLAGASSAFALWKPPTAGVAPATPSVAAADALPALRLAYLNTTAARNHEAIALWMAPGGHEVEFVPVPAGFEGATVVEGEGGVTMTGDEATGAVTFQAVRGALSLRLAEAAPDAMPNEGLIHAARLVYPFNLFELMPWIAPEAKELIAPPEEPSTEMAVALRFVRIQVQLEPALNDAILQPPGRLYVKQLNAASNAEIELVGEIIDEVEVEVEVEDP